MAGSIFIGAIIERELRSRGITVKAFALALGIKRPNAYRIFQSHSIDTDLLLRISHYLGCDFFRYYSDCFASAFPADQNGHSPSDQ